MRSTHGPLDSMAARRAAVEAAHGVSAMLCEGFLGRAPSAQKAGIHDIVTEYDTRAEESIRGALLAAFPDCGFVGEETGTSEEAARLVWHIDPIDGTSNFASGLPLWSVSIGAVIDGELAAGVVFDPMRKEMFSADSRGAYLNEDPLRPHAPEETTAAELLTCYPDALDFEIDGRERAGIALERLQGTFRAVRGLGSSALQLAWVAAGRAAATILTHQHSWDVAAGCCIVERGGGGFYGIRDGRVVAGTAAIVQPTVVASGIRGRYPAIAGILGVRDDESEGPE